MTTTPATERAFDGLAAAAESRQAGARAAGADSAPLIRQYEELRAQLVRLHAATEPDMAAIDAAIDRLAELQLEIKATRGLIGNNPIED